MSADMPPSFQDIADLTQTLVRHAADLTSAAAREDKAGNKQRAAQLLQHAMKLSSEAHRTYNEAVGNVLSENRKLHERLIMEAEKLLAD